mmetsp:Transcript_39993/g.96553  ORF Transcript_39993/g.96553 Transcript_39993/m.96553 type:complete len:123 (-) Transcript_39993:574-942(-)
MDAYETLETVSIDLDQIFGSNVVVSKAELEEAFVCTYNSLASRRFCNPAFATVSSATCLDEQIESVGDSSFNFAVNMRCRNCTGIFDGDYLEDMSVFHDGNIRKHPRSQLVSGFDGRLVNKW